MTEETIMDIIKTMPADTLATYRAQFENVGTATATAIARADVERAKIINDLMDIARTTGVSPKVATEDIMREVVKPCARTKPEQEEFKLLEKAGSMPATLAGKLGYNMGLAYGHSLELAFAKGIPFTPSLYHNHKKELAAKKQADHAEKVAQAEQVASDKAAEAKALASKAAKAKASDEVKLAAAQAKLDAEKAQQAVRKAIDAAPVSQKTGGRKAAPKSGPIKVLTRHEVALHATALVAMLESIGELSVASEVREILADNNLLSM
ncbi:MAG: hypothetical protein EHM17_16275 [Verrucomicrobiaceae bacterium]|nr:MAG: hypothetical protein EHM17_17105 [Verrucomicrobiaceae bacterium]RPJ30672.1 MAG: hypothetical protein EHM17_16275 [Verrucomicrobiaceae bacterium]